MINYSTITKAIEKYLNDNLPGYLVKRNVESNDDPNLAAQYKAWIGVYRGRLNYSAKAVGHVWKVEVSPVVEIQVASSDPETAEEKHETAVNAVMVLLGANLKLSEDVAAGTNGTVAMTNGYDLEYEYKRENAQSLSWHRCLITINSEVEAQS